MPHGSLFDEPRTDIVFVGTTSISPDSFIDDAESFFENPQEIRISLLDGKEKFTYEIGIVDVRHAEKVSNGEFEVTYQKPGCDAMTTSTVRIPEEFGVEKITV